IVMGLFVNRSTERMRRMLQSIRNRDFSLHFAVEKLTGAEKKLAEEMNDVISGFREDLMRQERQYGKYEAILNLVDTALIVADKEGRVSWMNNKAVNSLCGFQISHISMLDAVHPNIASELKSLLPGQTKMLAVNLNGREERLKLSMVSYSAGGAEVCIYSLENVNLLVQQSEIEAQRKLIRVLTHEIMNSLSPIISLSDMLKENKEQDEEEFLMALNAINRRSKGLLNFVENYRKLSRLSEPHLEWIRIGDVFDGMRVLFPETFIEFKVEEPDIQLHIDPHQIEQVLINLLKNAVEATKIDPSVVVSTMADHPNHFFFITVTDNGCGISPDAADSIFLPFFTTKSGGSGIGLSLSRQIVSMHGGSIKFDSSSDGSTFTIVLPLVYRL
ncbi:MAG: GHKL domain-containing protein, partial [Muribaculaceae bacterium]|nr:GHKL domain-containing protein [Muribaculaceae bacterium]